MDIALRIAAVLSLLGAINLIAYTYSVEGSQPIQGGLGGFLTALCVAFIVAEAQIDR